MASVASRNLFDLLGDVAEDTNIMIEDTTDTKDTVVVQKKVDRSRASRTEARIRHEYPQRGGFKAPTKTEETRAGGPRDRNVGPRLSGRRDREEGGGGGDYPSRTQRGARAGERTRGTGGRGARARGREFDRHSGTGRHDSEKKETQGWGNATKIWDNSTGEPEQSNSRDAGEGTIPWPERDAVDNKTWGSGDPAADANTSNWDSPKATDDPATWESSQPLNGNAAAEGDSNAKTETQQEDTSAADAPPIAEEVVKTLDEYLAEKAQKTLEIALPEVRKPNEGVDDAQWKDAVPLQKEEEEDFLFTGKEQSIRLKSKKSKAKNVLEIDQTFIERPGGGASQRGRGRGRGTRGSRGGRDGGDNTRDRRDHYRDDRREPRNESWGSDNRRGGGRSGVVNIDDVSAFPSLGSS